MKKEIKIFKSNAEQEKADIDYYLNPVPIKELKNWNMLEIHI